MMMLAALPWDVLYICAELMTGKSIPVLVAIAALPVGQALTWAMVTLGAVAGTLFSAYAVSHGGLHGLSVLSSANRMAQLCFSLWLSLSLLVSLAGGIHARRGASLVVIPAFCLVSQTLPQRHSTGLVSLVLCAATFYVCILAEAGAYLGPQAGGAAAAEQLLAAAAASGTSSDDDVLTLGQALLRSLQLLVLAFYACIQHAPTQTYFDLRGHRPAYASHHHARHAPYSLFVGLLCCWLRVCVWSGVCFMHDSQLYAMLEHHRYPQQHKHKGTQWACILFYMTALLYSACWTATQLREQVMPRFALESDVARTKVLVCVTALAAFYRLRDPEPMFYAANGMLALCVLTVLSQLLPAHQA